MFEERGNMGLVFQLQRRAIEDLRNEVGAAPITCGDIGGYIQTSTGERLYIAGISPGIGTCSDVHGMDVLVLSESPIAEQRNIGELACAYAVLVRDLTGQEATTDSLARSGVARRCVELLQPVGVSENGAAVFDRTGNISIYTKLVSG